jgi:two-component SAPR family response regulator
LSAFTTTLSRLRKLIGDEVIVVQGGRVSLDERRCWLDTWALKRHLIRLKLLADDSRAALNYVIGLLDLYRGQFLKDEKSDWIKQLRRRLRDEVALALARCIRILGANDSQAEVARVLRRIEVADPVMMDLVKAALNIDPHQGPEEKAST